MLEHKRGNKRNTLRFEKKLNHVLLHFFNWFFR